MAITYEVPMIIKEAIMKKTIKQITILLGLCLIFVSLFSCDDIVGLGAKLDIYGPVVTITEPPPRMPVLGSFVLKGTVTDNTGIGTLLVKVLLSGSELPRQWRYINNEWQITSNNGVNWATWKGLGNTSWVGNGKNALWSLDVELPGNGEYTMIVQAWDMGNFTDENSYKTRVVIVDKEKPFVSISEPPLEVGGGTNKMPTTPIYDTTTAGFDTNLTLLNDPANLGKFISREFTLQYQIDDNSDVSSIEIRLYDGNNCGVIDQDLTTPLPDNYIYKFNEGVPPTDTTPGSNIRPNRTIQVPALDSTTNTEIKNPLTKKTSVIVVAVCYDAAKNINQEKILGSFIYWPRAELPWIEFAAGLKNSYPADGSYTMYPGRKSSATAFQPYGVTKVAYKIYKLSGENVTGSPSSITGTSIQDKTAEPDLSNTGGAYPKTFTWTFEPPSSTGYYTIQATAYGTKTKEGKEPTETYEVTFFVQDVTFPDFLEEPSPSASLPLFESMGNSDTWGGSAGSNQIRIYGTVSDATGVESVYLTWINPESKNYAAMAQLAYFRDSSYLGWRMASGTLKGTFPNNYAEEKQTTFTTDESGKTIPEVEFKPYDSARPNKVWNVPITQQAEKINDRIVYRYSQVIDITDHLNIAGSVSGKDNPLKSQTFLLRVRNTSGKCTIITYAPKGDESAPVITKMTEDGKEHQIKVTVSNSSGTTLKTCYSGHYELIEQFNDGNKITVQGEWEEDSTEFLNFETYLKDNFEIKINDIVINGKSGTGTSLTFSPPTGKAKKGTWKAEATLGSTSSYLLQTSNIKDTLVVSVKVTDIGGNITEAGGSWLIRSDKLRLLRISSEMPDTKYKASDTPIRIFLEFNKPVQLVNSSAKPELQLNVTGKTAVYSKYGQEYGDGKPEQTATQSTRQYFDYIVKSGDVTSTPVLDVLGLEGVTTANNQWQPNASPSSCTYPFYWISGTGTDAEYIKITHPTSTSTTTHVPNATTQALPQDTSGAYLRRLPIYTQEQTYSLRGGKSIEIDTTPPKVVKITSSNPAGFYTTGADIFIDVEFSEPVKIIDGTPQLTLRFRDPNSNLAITPKYTNGSVKVNDKKISFSYNVKAGDTTAGLPLIITDFQIVSNISTSRYITDIAGNALVYDFVNSSNANFVSDSNRTLNDIGVEANAPSVPTAKIITASNNYYGSITNVPGSGNVIQNNVNGGDIFGFSNTGYADWSGGSAPTEKDLATLYNDKLWFAIDANIPDGVSGAKQTHKFASLEYSFNNGTDWIRATTVPNTPALEGDTLTSQYFVMQLPRPGEYKITTRQIDKAGNVSNWTQPIILNLDPGTLVTNVTSTSANGTYTHITDPVRNIVNIRINFRKSLTFTSVPTLTLNARNSSTPPTYLSPAINSGQIGVPVNYLDYTYTVYLGHNIASNANLDVTDITGTFVVKDSAGVNVSQFIKLPAAGSNALLKENKDIRIDTSPLAIDGNPQFSTGTVNADGSWSGTLTIKFNNNPSINNNTLSKGKGDLRIEQVLGTSSDTYYRLPAVLTEAQYNKLKSNTAVPNVATYIDTFYTKGTNGCIIDGTNISSDTATKYILAYAHNTAGITPSATGTLGSIERFANDMRLAEAVVININSQVLTVSGNTLTVTLSGSNVLQVAGASYSVTYPANFVQDNLGNQIAARTTSSSDTGIATNGIAKPYIRIKKSQDTITAQTGSNNAPIYEATQPLTSSARMDCRTPGASVVYRYQESRTTTNQLNWSQSGPTDSLTSGNPDPNSLGDPRNTTTGNYGTFLANTTPITLPITSTDQSTYQGYQCLIRAVGRKGTTGAYTYSSENSHEIAYRTVLTYEVRDMRNETGSWGQNLTSTPSTGAQVWIRGGDAIGSSTTPGFPLTWGDDWSDLKGKRAGIRLLTRRIIQTQNMTTAQQTNLNYSVWQFVTWEIAVPAYFDMIKGNNITNTQNDAAVTWQYGPSQWAYQRAGWTSFKEQYPMYPGKHRWLYVNADNSFANKGQVNFSGTFSSRATFTTTDGWTGANTVDAAPQ